MYRYNQVFLALSFLSFFCVSSVEAAPSNLPRLFEKHALICEGERPGFLNKKARWTSFSRAMRKRIGKVERNDKLPSRIKKRKKKALRKGLATVKSLCTIPPPPPNNDDPEGPGEEDPDITPPTKPEPEDESKSYKETTVSWEQDFSFPAQDEEGWSIFKPSSDSRIIYVSASEGDDASGAVYGVTSPLIGPDPQDPIGAVKPFATIDTALAAARDNFPDWVLLKRGDTWQIDSRLSARAGRSESERFLLGSYGKSTERPLIRTGMTSGIRFWVTDSYSAVVGLNFYADQRDPLSPTFVGFDAVVNAIGFQSYTGDGDAPDRNHAILIEDCIFNFYAVSTIEGSFTKDFIVRRSQFLNNYSTSSHSQGLYANNASVYLEENLFDHNGWYKQQIDTGNDADEGQATFFNHNTYFSGCKKLIFRRNIFARAASIGNKFTANSPGAIDEIMAENILVENNLYLEGEIGLSVGGNTDNDNGFRWKNMQILGNVLLSVGRARPTNRSLGWGIDGVDWDGGRISNNFLLGFGDATVTNVYGINYIEHGRDIEINDNVIYDLRSNHFVLRVLGNAPVSNFSVRNNQIQLAGLQTGVLQTEVLLPNMFSGNIYTSGALGDRWFSVNGNLKDFDTWVKDSGEVSAVVEELEYPLPMSSIEEYQSAINQEPTIEAFINAAKAQSKSNWRKEYQVSTINDFIKAGFQLQEN